MKLSDLSGEAAAIDPDISGLTADSRCVKAGYLFAAMPGVIADGAKFIPQAEERGAAAILARPGVKSRLPIVIDDEPRRRFAQMAAKFSPNQPDFIAGITGTNGKTSTAFFAAQLWKLCGRASGSIGTLGAVGEGYTRALQHTTPEPATLHEVLGEFTDAGITAVAMEVSSHALAQYRADGVRFSCAAFTNITQDHLDFHKNFDEYFGAKARLFTDLLSENGVVVVNKSGNRADQVSAIARSRKLKIIEAGIRGADICLQSIRPGPDGLKLSLLVFGEKYEIQLRLVGAFQAENALVAAGIVIASGEAPEKVFSLIENITGVPGRMQHVGDINSAGVYVDYAHTPDAIATALKAIRPHTPGKVVAVIGAGGNRDKTKRQLMGAAALQNADIVIVTDDNPRSEDPIAIRREIMLGCPEAIEIGDRAEAISAGVETMNKKDVLLIMGKGHETGQQVGDQTLPFSDAEAAKAAISAAAARRVKENGR